MQTLVYHAGALGDFITTLPALHLYAERTPDASIVFLGKREHGALGVDARYFRSFIDIDESRCAALFSDTCRFDALPEMAASREAVVFAEADSPLVRTLSRLNLAALYHQAPFPPERVHVVDYHLSLFRDPPLRDRQPCIVLDSARVTGRAVPLHGPVVIHPGSGSVRKNWDIARFAEVAGCLRARGLDVVWSLGPAERDLLLPPDWTVVRPTSLRALADLLCQARLFVGNDSGVSHLAAAVGCPTIALFGPSDPQVWAPRGPCVRIVAAPHGTMADIAPEQVRQACAQLLDSMV